MEPDKELAARRLGMLFVAGAAILVAGQAIFGEGDPSRNTRALREVCDAFVGVDGAGAVRRDR